jgi:hypothetical protein
MISFTVAELSAAVQKKWGRIDFVVGKVALELAARQPWHPLIC